MFLEPTADIHVQGAKQSPGPKGDQDRRHILTSIMPHKTAAAASATGTPAPIEGAGAPSGMAWAADAAAAKHPPKMNDFIDPFLKVHPDYGLADYNQS